MLCGKNREKWEGRQSLGVKSRTLLAWAASAVPLTHNSRMTTNLYFCLITSNFIHFQYEARCSEHLEWENHSAWVFFPDEKILRSTPSGVLTAHTEWLPGVWLWHTNCAVHTEDYEGWWSSGCHVSVAEHWRLKPEVSCMCTGLTPGDCAVCTK